MMPCKPCICEEAWMRFGRHVMWQSLGIDLDVAGHAAGSVSVLFEGLLLEEKGCREGRKATLRYGTRRKRDCLLLGCKFVSCAAREHILLVERRQGGGIR